MKIAIVYDAVFPYVKGGGERRYYELARRLSARHDVHVVSWHYWPGPAQTRINGIMHHGVGRPPALYGPSGRRRMSEAAAFAARATPLLARERFDLIDCASVPFLPLIAARAASWRHGTKLVATWFEFWDAYWLTYLGGAAGRAARTVERIAARAGHAQIAISQTTADRMARARPRGMPVHVIEPGIDAEAIAAVPAPPQRYDIAFAGRLIAQKNVPLLLEAVALLVRDHAGLSCAIISDGPERARLEQQARDLGIEGAVQFLGRVESDAAFFGTLKSARVFAWPSVAEGFGIAPLEAMACGLPVVAAASEYSATAALVRDGVTGLVAAAEPAAFATALGALLDDEERRARMGAAALAHAGACTWDVMAAAVEEVYVGVCG